MKTVKSLEVKYHNRTVGVLAETKTVMCAFQYDKEWLLEHATCINGNGANPGMKEILQVAEKAGLSRRIAKNIAEDVQEIVNEKLSRYLVKV